MSPRALMTSLAIAVASAASAYAGPITLQESLINLNGTTYHNTFAVPALNASLFNSASGLGTLQLTFYPGAAGSYYFGVFLDHQLHAQFNNEQGVVLGAPGAGVSWQLDNPGTGTIFANTSAATLDNTNHVPGSSDVSMALGFSFILSDNEYARITVDATQTRPSGFYLEQIDSETPDFLYLTPSISIQQGPPPEPVVPEPASFSLVGLGLAALGRVVHRLRR